MNSAGQRSDGRIRESVPVKSQAQNPKKSSSRPPTALRLELNQKMRGHILNRKGRQQTQRGNQQKMGEAEVSGLENQHSHNQYSYSRRNAVVVPMQDTKQRDSVRHPAQRPSGHDGSPKVSSSEGLKRETRTSQTGTCITVELLHPTPVEVLNDSLETQTGRKICLYILKFNLLIHILVFSVISMVQ